MSDPTVQFTDAKWMGLSEKLLDRLRGKMTLIQDQQERHALAADALDDVSGELGDELRVRLADEPTRKAFLRAFISYELIEEFLQDPLVEDIMINSTESIFVHKTGQGLVKTEKRFPNNRALEMFVNKLIVFGGRAELSQINDVELSEVRGRVNIVRSPFGPQVTITRAKERALSIIELIDKGLCTYELAAQLWIYVEGLSIRPANLLISGEPGAGKTTLLNALLSFVPWSHRMVVIEDTLELNTKFLEACSRLESSGSLTMEALVKNSLRMRPDRIIIGEVRGREARDLMTAINLGKYCMGTLHASTARETLLRLQNEPMNAPETLTNLVDVLIVLKRLNLWGQITRVVGEVVETSGMEKNVVLLSPVWTYDSARHRAVETSPSSAYRDRLAQASGFLASHIIAETVRRANILRLLHTKLRVSDVHEVTKFCQLYVADPDKAIEQLGVTAKELERKSS
ncbi:MAG TPA: hypothetical protein DDX89_05555 [Candidatus Omnitrophica bacterium]|nr:hypothetical protein [Candidatus Omnitrophota bacterium]HBQ37824.1 hypothetical protein [Candidatus Omnitrophota bacterium]